MSKKIFEFLFLILLFPVGFWLVSEISLLPVIYQVYASAAAVALLALVLMGRGVAFDLKMLLGLCCGYALAGKGFAYISPRPPLYIGEITFAICFLGFLIRIFGDGKIKVPYVHVALLGWVALVGGYLFINYSENKMLALRDSSIGYYALFAIMGTFMCREEKSRRFLERIFPLMIFLACAGMLIAASPLFPRLLQTKFFAGLFFPHPDAYVPFMVAGATWGILKGINQGSILKILGGMVIVVLLLSTKTAGIFSLLIAWLVLLVVAKRYELVVVGILTSIASLLLVGILTVGDFKVVNDYLKKSDQVSTFTSMGAGDGSGRSSTTEWRIVWWTIVFKDTVKNNPAFGVGLGGDITSQFIQTAYKRIADASDARYAHNFVFTVLGRMGFVGLACMVVVWSALIKFLVFFGRTYLRGRTCHFPALAAYAFVVGGMANALVQSTYEVPFGAIPHWAFFGYLMAYHYYGGPVLDHIQDPELGLPSGTSKQPWKSMARQG